MTEIKNRYIRHRAQETKGNEDRKTWKINMLHDEDNIRQYTICMSIDTESRIYVQIIPQLNSKHTALEKIVII